MRSTFLWSAALLGALGGALVAKPLARACDCVTPNWTLKLSEESRAVGDASAWPFDAQLEAYPGVIRITSSDMSGATIDSVQAGGP